GAHVDLLPDAQQVGVGAQLAVDADQVRSAHTVAARDLTQVLARHDHVGVEGRPVAAGLAVLGALGLRTDLDDLADPQRVGILLELRVAALDRLDADPVLGGDAAERVAALDLVLGDGVAAATRAPSALRAALAALAR